MEGGEEAEGEEETGGGRGGRGEGAISGEDRTEERR